MLQNIQWSIKTVPAQNKTYTSRNGQIHSAGNSDGQE